MKNHYPLSRYLLWVFSLLLLLSSGRLLAQQSSNTVKYRVTYSATTQRYTVWVVPDYATPNTYNGGSSEFSSTAQVTLKVPIGFVIQNIQDASSTQSWEKAPAKLGPGLSLTATNGTVFTQDYSPAVLDPNYAYYVMGKAPTESNLGAFAVGVPVALFTFSGNGCFGPIQIMPPGDPFIQAAYDAYSYNVPNSFYSSSGQPAGGNQDPLEQFIAVSGASADCTPPQTPTVVITGPAMGTTVASLNPPISGTATPGSSVTVTGPNGQSCITTAAIPSGTWTCTSLTFVNGPASVTAITSLSGVTGVPAVDNFIIDVPGSFAFNCTNSSLSAGLKVGVASNATLTIGITNATAGPVSLTLSGAGFASVVSPFNTTLTAGQTSISIPISYDGSGPAGVRTLSVSSAQATGSCSVTVNVANINAPTVVITGPAMGSTVASLNPPISGTATPGSSVTVTGPNGQSCVVVAAIPSGTWTCTSLTFVNGPASVTAITSLSGVTGVPAVDNFIIDVPGSFAFNCSSSNLSAGLKVGIASSATLTIGITNATAGPVSLTLSGAGFASVPSPINTTLTAGQTSLVIPISYDGSGPAGVRTLSVNSAQATGSCLVTVTVANINAPTVVITGPAMGTTVASLNPPISGTATPGSSVTVTGPNGQSCVVVAAVPSGTWTCTSLTFVNGPASVTAITSLSGVTGVPAVDNFIINVPGSFAFNCTTSSLSAGLKVGVASNATLTIGITNATAGPVSLSLSGSGFASVPSSVNLTLTAGQTSISIPISYDGSGPAGVRTLSVNSAQATGSCSVTVNVANINAPTVVITGPAMGTTVASLNPPISGTATPGSSVTVTGPNGQSCVVVAAIPSGTWTCTSLTFVNGPASVTAITSLSGVTGVPAVDNFIVAVPQPPLVRPDSATTVVGASVSGNVLTNDTDPQLSPLTASLIGSPTAGTVTMSSTGNYTYTPPANFTGVASFCYRATNTAGLSASTCVSITVVPVPIVNMAPVAVNDQAQTPMNQPVVIGVLANDSDPNSSASSEGQLGKPTLLGQPASGTAIVNPNGTVTYTPPTNFTGVVSFPYQVCDQATLPLCATALVSVTVVSSLKPPVAVDDSLVTSQNTAKASNVSPNDYDPQSLTMIYSSGQPQHGTVVMAANGIYTYTPADGYTGPDSFTYSVCNIGFCSRATVYITVRPLPIVTLRLKVLLQGALVGGTNGLMRDDLRSQGFLPTLEPYSAIGAPRFTHVNGGGGETLPASVTALNVGTGDAVVDWVFVELRSATNASTVVATRSALVQRDGDVVLASDGVSPLSFTGLTGSSFYVSVKHRNHLGAMTSTAIPLSTTGTLVDFTTMTGAQLWNTSVGTFDYDGWEQTAVNGRQALWAGDANHNSKVKYQGSANDLITIFSEVIGAQVGNTSPLYNYNNAFGYYFGDVNLDGKVKYQGTSNDTSLIFTNLLTNYNTLNSGQLYNFDWMLEQIP